MYLQLQYFILVVPSGWLQNLLLIFSLLQLSNHVHLLANLLLIFLSIKSLYILINPIPIIDLLIQLSLSTLIRQLILLQLEEPSVLALAFLETLLILEYNWGTWESRSWLLRDCWWRRNCWVSCLELSLVSRWVSFWDWSTLDL